MNRVLLWLLASLAFASFNSLADGTPLKVMSAPNLLRVGTAENVFVECLDCSGGDIRVDICVMSHPTKSTQLATTSVHLTSANDFQELAQIMIPAGGFSKDPTIKQYVYLQAQFPDQLLEKVVLVSFQSGYIFIQTDKTLYTPNSRVHFRMFALTPRMEPVQRNDQIDDSITIEIVTPDNIVLHLDTVSPKSGIHAGDYRLGEIVSPGQWKLVAKFYSNPQTSFSAEFEVKEYMLPSFEVKLTARSSFFYVDSQEFTVNIKATYLFGEEVNGMAYVLFGVYNENQKQAFPGSLQRVSVTLGNSEATLKREHITETFPNINQLVGQSIFVDVIVLMDNGGEMVEATLRGIRIVTSPYSIHFKSTPTYYKPGMSFDVTVEVLNPDDTPAKGVPVVVEPGPVHGLTAANGRARLSVNTVAATSSLTVTAWTNVHRINQQASVTMQALPYSSKGNNYIHISLDTADLKLGDNLKINLILNRLLNNEITYLILNRGQLVKNGRYKTQDQTLISLNLVITKEMVPSFRIVAYYHTHDNEIVSDSVWVDVKDTCMSTLNLESTRPKQSYEPRQMFGLKVTGDPEATVGLVAVDKGVYFLNNKHQLTQKKVWDTVKKLDTGCTPGGGKDAMNVFYDAGLLFETSTGSGTLYRQGVGIRWAEVHLQRSIFDQKLRCPTPSRRRRRNTVMDDRTTLASPLQPSFFPASQYDDKLQRDSCVDGMRDTSLSVTCERRSEYIMGGSACVEAFLHCCKQKESKQAERKDNLPLAQSEEDENAYMDSNEIVSRTYFPESWMWADFKLPPCPQETPDCETTTDERNIPLPYSITTWKFTGISLSRTHGICVGDPLEVVVRKEFFIDLRLPYSAVRGEEVEVKAILYNYSPDHVIVRVELLENEHVCSSASNHRKYRQEVRMAAQSTRSVPFILTPMKEGLHSIEVKAAVKDTSLSDAIGRMLRVVPAGVLIKSPKIVSLDPGNEGVGGKQEVILNSQIPEKDLVPNTPTITEISVTGKKEMVSFVENFISGNSMAALIYQPSGSGEENMIHMTLPVIATTYLDKTNQWETVGFQKRIEAIQHIKTGYQNELAYQKNDGSFASLPNRPSSTR